MGQIAELTKSLHAPGVDRGRIAELTKSLRTPGVNMGQIAFNEETLHWCVSVSGSNVFAPTLTEAATRALALLAIEAQKHAINMADLCRSASEAIAPAAGTEEGAAP